MAVLSTHLHPETHGGSFHGRRRSRSRSRSPSVSHRHQSPTQARGRSPTPIGRSTSPQKQDHGFAETVNDIVDYVKFETSKKGRARGMGSDDNRVKRLNKYLILISINIFLWFLAKLRGESEWFGSPTLGRSPSRHGSKKTHHRPWTGPGGDQERSRSASPDYRTAGLTLESRSRSPSPHRLDGNSSEYYGTTQLEQRSRSPSPSSAHSLPVRGRRPGTGRSGKRRLLPHTPNKPSFLRLTVQSVENINFPLVSHSPTIPNRTPSNINFPKLNASPTHLTKQNPPPQNWTVTAGNGLSTLLAPLRAIGRANSSSCLTTNLLKRCGGVARELPQPPMMAPTPHMPYSQSMGAAAPSSLHTWKEEAPISFEAANAPALALITSTCDNRSRVLPLMTNGFKHMTKPKAKRTDRPLLANQTTGNNTHQTTMRARSAGGHRPQPTQQQQRPNSSLTMETLADTQHMDTDEEDDTDWC